MKKTARRSFHGLLHPRHYQKAAYRVARRVIKVGWYGLAVVFGLIAVSYVAARLALPLVSERKAELEEFLSQQAGYAVSIGQLDTYWDGLYPGFHAQKLRIERAPGAAAAVELHDLRVSPKLMPLLFGRLEIRSLVLGQPKLTLERLVDGRFRVSGFEPVVLESSEPQQTEKFAAWLLSQRLLVVEDAEVHWIDKLAGEEARLTQVNLELFNSGARHRLGVRARFPRGMCDDCSMVADLTDNPFAGEPFDGDIYLHGSSVDLERLPAVIRERLPSAVRGTFSVELWSEWRNAALAAVEGEIAVSELRLPLARLRHPLAVRQASAQVRWEGDRDDFLLSLNNLQLNLNGTAWPVGDMELVRRKRELLLRADSVDLADISALVVALRPEQEADRSDVGSTLAQDTLALWSVSRPSGEIKELQVQLLGLPDALEDFTISADIENLAFLPFARWPGLSGVNGRVSVRRDAGELELDVRDGTMAMPYMFRAALPISRATANVRWQRDDTHWLVIADDIAIANDDLNAQGRAKLELPHDHTSPHLMVKGTFRDGNGSNAGRYAPVNYLSPNVISWIERSFVDATITDGSLLYDGRIDEFPFHNGQGRFELQANVRDGIYRYLAGWEPVRNIAANVAVTGTRFLVTGRGTVGTLKVERVVASNDDGAVSVKASVRGAVSEHLRVLQAAKTSPSLAPWRAWVSDDLSARGDGVLGLDLSIPLHDEHGPRISGEYRLTDAALRFKSAPEVSAIHGTLQFTHAGIETGTLRAQFLGGESALAMSSPRTGELVALAEGTIMAEALAPIVGEKFAPRIKGAAPWKLRLRTTKERKRIEGEVELSGLKLLLPAPLDRANGISADKLIAHAEAATPDQFALSLSAGTLLQGRMKFVREQDWRLSAGRILFNQASLPVVFDSSPSFERGLHVLLRLGDVDLDQWSDLLRGGDDAPIKRPQWMARISAEASGVTVLDRKFGHVGLDLVRVREGWGGSLSGESAVGRVYFAVAPTVIEFDLARLVVPPALDSQRKNSDIDPRRLPRVMFKVQSLFFMDKDLQQFDFAAGPNEHGWKIDKFSLSHYDTRFDASGEWRYHVGQPSSDFTIHLKSPDLGKTVAALGVPDEIEGADVDMKGRLTWAGEPSAILRSFSSLNGSLELRAKDGRFLAIKPGASRILGILDLSAILRYLILDFSPVFGKGFAFENISGKFKIERGHAFTDNFQMKGPNARIHANGRVGLAVEDFNLTVDVYPNLSNSLALGSLLAAGPQVALWALLVNRLLKRQIDEGTRVTYFVHGAWKDPVIKRETTVRTPDKTSSQAPSPLPGRSE